MGKRKNKNRDAAKASEDPSFRVQIVPKNGPNFTLEIEKKATVCDLKILVEQRMGLSKQHQYLKYNGWFLEDSQKLEESFRPSLFWRLVQYLLALLTLSNLEETKTNSVDVTLELPALRKDWNDINARDHCYFDHKNDIHLTRSTGEKELFDRAISNLYDWKQRTYQSNRCGYLKPLKVRGKYESNAWLGDFGHWGEWAVAYHGSSYQNIHKIIQCGRLLEKFGERFVHGPGIYCSPNPSTALSYAEEFVRKGVDHKAILQVRVDCGKVKKVGDYWVVPEDYIRITGVCIYSKKDYASLSL